MDRLKKHFETITFHRTFTDYFKTLHKVGFYVSRLIEPKATPKAISEYPHNFTKHLKTPESVVIEAIKKI